MQRIIEMLEREDGYLSLGRVLAVVVFIIWAGITIGTFVMNKPYAHYDYLTYFNAFCIGSVICGKWVDFKNPALK